MLKAIPTFAAAAALMTLVACEGMQDSPVADPRVDLLSACDAWTATLTGLARLRAAGQLSGSQIDTVDRLIPSIKAVCDTPPPGDGAAVAATLVQAAIREATR